MGAPTCRHVRAHGLLQVQERSFAYTWVLISYPVRCFPFLDPFPATSFASCERTYKCFTCRYCKCQDVQPVGGALRLLCGDLLGPLSFLLAGFVD